MPVSSYLFISMFPVSIDFQAEYLSKFAVKVPAFASVESETTHISL
jgi:hypothetical protein